jgi:hypothetical protein
VFLVWAARASWVAGNSWGGGGEPVSPRGFAVFCYFMIALLQVFAVVLSVMSAGGISARELAGEMVNAYEVMRRGEETKEVIIPIRGRVPGAAKAAAGAAADEDRPRERINLDLPEDEVKPSVPAEKRPDPNASIPMDE